MRHNPETYALRVSRAFLKQGLQNFVDPEAHDREVYRGGLGNLRYAITDLEFVLLPWPEQRELYLSENGYLAIRERERELFLAFATLFVEIYHSLDLNRRLRLKIGRHPRFEELKKLGGLLLNLMEPDEIDRLEEAPVTMFFVDTKLGIGNRVEMYYSILREVFNLYDSDRYPVWYPDTKRAWFDSRDEPFTSAEFENWLFQPDGHGWFYGRYAFSKDESHSVYMDGDSFDTFLTFTVATEDVPKTREMITGIEGLYQVVCESKPGNSDETAVVYGKPFIKHQQPAWLLANRHALRQGLFNLTDTKLNEWWKVETCFTKLHQTAELLSRVCTPWESKKEDYLSEHGHLAIRVEEYEEFEQLALLYEQIRGSCSREERFEFEFLNDERWEQLVGLGRSILPKIDLLNSPGFNEFTTAFVLYLKTDETGSDLPGDFNFRFVLKQILDLYEPEEYPFWYPTDYHPRDVPSYNYLVAKCLQVEHRYTPDHFSYAKDESHSVFIKANDADLEIEFSVENSHLHLVNELVASIEGLYSQFLMVDENKKLVEYKL